ncbi:unnamed protein product [Urochloa humidicola]
MMLLFDSREQRDAVVNDQPIIHDGGRLTFERSEETSNRFVAIPEWLVAVSSLDFPPEHWNRANVPAAFRKLGTVVEIDPACLDGDYSSMRVIIERLRPTRIPDDLWISNPGGLGTTFRVAELRGPWRREEQLDAQGNLHPFFPRPPPGPGGNGLHGSMPGHMAPLLLLDPHYLAQLAAQDCLRLLEVWADLMGAWDASRALTPSSLGTSIPTLCHPSLPCHRHPRPAAHPHRRRYPLTSIPHQPPPHLVPPCLPRLHPAAPSALTRYHTPAFTRLHPPPPPLPCAPAPRRRRKQSSAAKIKRQSTRLAEKEEAEFVDATTKAMQRKAIRESLAACSKDLKHHVKTRKLLKKKNPLGALDLGRLAKVAGIGCAGCRAIAVAAATGRSP